ncbi:MAG: polysaccharide biosynthesis/export family protein [Flammeovirgaceae bacterium]
MKSIPNIALLLALLLFSSCQSTNLFERSKKAFSSVEALKNQTYPPYRIRTDDKISVSIWNHDDLSVGSIFGIYNSNEVYGKWVLVEQSGDIQLPKIGTVKAQTHTIQELQNKLKEKYAAFIVNPIVVVKVLNREVTVLGEVKDAGTFLLEKEHNTLIELLGRAGGLNFYADQKKVQLIRKVGIVEKQYLIDLSKLEEYELHQIQLLADDVIYVPTKKGKSLDKKAPTLIPFTSVLTSLGIVYSLFRK